MYGVQYWSHPTQHIKSAACPSRDVFFYDLLRISQILSTLLCCFLPLFPISIFSIMGFCQSFLPLSTALIALSLIGLNAQELPETHLVSPCLCHGNSGTPVSSNFENLYRCSHASYKCRPGIIFSCNFGRHNCECNRKTICAQNFYFQELPGKYKQKC